MIRTIIACATLGAIAGGASAATVKATYTGLGQHHSAFGLNYKNGRFTANVAAGELKHQFSNESGNLFAGQTLKTFCIDIAETVVNQERTYNITGVSTAPDGDAPAGHVIGATRSGYIASLYAGAINAGLLDHRGSAIGFADGKHAAAFQLVIWELAFESETILAVAQSVGLGALGDYSAANSFGTGEMKISNSASLQQAHFNTFLGWAFSEFQLDGLRAMTFQGAQDQLIVIPLPTGGALALAGLAGVAIRRRR